MHTETPNGQTLAEIAKSIVSYMAEMEDKRDNGQLLAEHGLRIVHIRPNEYINGMTIAYREAHKRASVVEIATAITHKNDHFTKKIGTRLAIEAFIAGRTVLVPKTYRNRPASDSLLLYFAY